MPTPKHQADRRYPALNWRTLLVSIAVWVVIVAGIVWWVS